MGELAEQPEDTFSHEYVFNVFLDSDSKPHFRERREHKVFQQLLQMIPGLEECLMEGSDDDIVHVAELVCGIFDSIFGTLSD